MEEFANNLEKFLKTFNAEYKPTQNKLSIPLVYRIYKKMKGGLQKFDAIKVCENLIIDGHHRYIASILSGVLVERFPSTKNHNQIVFDWSDVGLVTTEYDSDSEIKYHNFNDAQRNSISVEEIDRILNT